ncbi:MAG TPA: Brp/Blh family beta-carotene 15,15'-dioxygenase [Desulfobacterales bacterium]
MNSHRAFPAWTIRHAGMFAIVSVMVLAGSALWGTGSTSFHLGLLLVLAAFFGIPHGALDYVLAEPLLRPRYGRKWGVGFIAAYLAGMAVIVALWWAFPTASLTAFLILTLVHFGSGDALSTPKLSRWLRWSEMLARGGVVLTFPAIFSRQEVLQLFAYMVPETGALALVAVLAALAPVAALALVCCLSGSLLAYKVEKNPLELARGLELLALAALFVLLPALLAFAVYFNFLHSIRHLHRAAGDRHPSALSASFAMIKAALPITVLTLVLGAAAYLLLSGVRFDVPGLVRVTFIGIAAMTYPHALVVAVADAAGGLDHRPSSSDRTLKSKAVALNEPA